jgi:predicted transposase YbfD/YdcC
MAKAKKPFDIGETIGSILKIIVLAIVGFVAFMFVRENFLKSREEKEKEEQREQKGAFRNFIDFLFGEGASASAFPTSTEKEQERTASRDEAQERAVEEAKKEVERIEDLMDERDKLAEKMTDNTVGASNLSDAEREKLLAENKKLAEQIVKAKADAEKARKEAEKKGKAPPPKTKEEIFDRGAEGFKIFRFEKPLVTKKALVSDIAIATTNILSKDKATQTKEAKAFRAELKQQAVKEATTLGFKLQREIRDEKGKVLTTLKVPQKPVTQLKPETIERLERDPEKKKQIENIIRRRLGQERV